MAQKRLEEKIEATDQEIASIHLEIQKLPMIEETMSSLAKSVETLNLHADKQQRTSKDLRKILSTFLSEVAQSRSHSNHQQQ